MELNRKDRAINLGLKIKSLEGNLSVAKSVIKELEEEIKSASIDEEDRDNLLKLYDSVIQTLKETKSPSVIKRNEISQTIEDLYKELRSAGGYSEINRLEGRVHSLGNLINDPLLKKEHKAVLKKKISSLTESYNKKIGAKLQKNFEKMERTIDKKCKNENPFFVSMAIKELNKEVQVTPLFTRDRHKLQALLDTYWQKSSRDIKEIKESSEK